MRKETIMTVREIIICLSKQEGLTQEELAHKLGLKGSANIAVPLSRNDGMGMKVDTLVRWLEALNAEIVIQYYDGEHEFILDGDEFGVTYK